jgi:hypothetical protein
MLGVQGFIILAGDREGKFARIPEIHPWGVT